MNDHLAEVGLAMPSSVEVEPTSAVIGPSPTITEDPHPRMAMDSPLDAVGAGIPNTGVTESSLAPNGASSSIPGISETAMDVDRTEGS